MAKTAIETTVEKRYGLHIGGREVPAQSGAMLDSVNPATGHVWATISDAGAADVEVAIASASEAFDHSEWRSLSPTRRGRLLMRLGEEIAAHADDIAAIETRDNGKLYREQLAQLRSVPEWLYYFGGLADKVQGSVIPLDRQSVLNYTVREPLGVIAVVTPWNSPTLIAVEGIAPALAAGNTVVVKPSEVASASLLEFARLATEAGFPPGVINVVTGGPACGQALVNHRRVAKVTFTGSTETGRAIGAVVGGRLGHVTLELGGKSPNIVFADAELDAALPGVLAGIYGAAGQTCVAGSRALIEGPVYEEFVERIVDRARRIKVGDPMDPTVEMGPIASFDQLKRIESLVDEARNGGAAILCGGARASVDDLPSGYFYQPTVVSPVSSNDRVVQDEVFGPVLTVLPFRDEQEALKLANASRYGLAAGLWTSNIKRGHRLARLLQAGTVWLNMYRSLTFNSPFGGYKDSGVGRENGIEAIYEYLQTKSVWCELGEEIPDPFVLRV